MSRAGAPSLARWLPSSSLAVTSTSWTTKARQVKSTAVRCPSAYYAVSHSCRAAPAWRVVVGLSLIPAFGTLYWRLTLPESTRYIRSQHQSSSLDSAGTDSDAPGSPVEGKLEADAEKDAGKDDTDGTAVHVAEVTRKTYFRGTSPRVFLCATRFPRSRSRGASRGPRVL